MLALFKVGDPTVISRVSLELADKLTNTLGSVDNFVITGPPSDEIRSSSRILAEKVAKQLNIKSMFPRKLRSASGYSKLSSPLEKRQHLYKQFTFEDGGFAGKNPLITDDVLVSGVMASTINEELTSTNNPPSDLVGVVWDFSGLPMSVESRIFEITRELSLQISDRIQNEEWHLTSGLEKMKRLGIL